MNLSRGIRIFIVCRAASDAYRDLAYNGGIPDPHFIKRLQVNHVSAVPGAKREDMIAEMERYPFADAPLWLDKKADISRIRIPVYCVASYSNTLHTMGTFRQWRKISITDKWLQIHNTQEWPDYYSDAGQEDRQKFFDRYLKGIDNGREEIPHVCYSLLDMEGGDQLNLPAETFGDGKNVTYTKFYLDGKFRQLKRDVPEEGFAAKYDTRGLPGRISFMVTFDEETNLVGYPKLYLYDVVMSPIGMAFHKGESIRVIISAKEEYGNGMMPGTPGCIPENRGWQVIHTGVDKASYLQLPVLKL